MCDFRQFKTSWCSGGFDFLFLLSFFHFRLLLLPGATGVKYPAKNSHPYCSADDTEYQHAKVAFVRITSSDHLIGGCLSCKRFYCCPPKQRPINNFLYDWKHIRPSFWIVNGCVSVVGVATVWQKRFACGIMNLLAGIVKRSNTTDCKSVGNSLRRFESFSQHQIKIPPSGGILIWS